MRWYVRGADGKAAGPFEESVVLASIRSGVRPAQVAPEGSTAWLPLESVPAFTVAISTAASESSSSRAAAPRSGPTQPNNKLGILLGIMACLFGIAWLVIGPEMFGARRSASAVASPPMQVDLEQILAEYKNNEVRADGRFRGVRIHTGGPVARIGKDVLDHPYLILRGSAVSPDLQCLLADGQSSVAASLAVGGYAAVTGIVSGETLMSVTLRDCRIDN